MTEHLERPGGTIVITGAAGSGKSILMAQAYAATANSAWLSIDPIDNDPVVFWSSVTETIGRVLTGFGSSFHQRLRSPKPRLVETIVPAAVNELLRAGEPVVLFLDDIQFLENRECIRALAACTEQRPDVVSVVDAGRLPPPFPLRRTHQRRPCCAGRSTQT